jgi:ribosomal protein S18 acetylase RimI-like enzyme
MIPTSSSMPDTSVLDNPAWASLTGAHANIAVGGELARHYDPEVSVFAGLRDVKDPAAWAELSAISDPGQNYGVISVHDYTPPTGWERPFGGIGLQLIGPDVFGEPDPETTPLTAEHIDAILELIELTRPGPFNPRTIELGGYIGIWREDRLAAMGGFRLHPGDWIEISAVCTHPDFQRQGLSTRVVKAVAHSVRSQGAVPMLHMAKTNEAARRVYENLGFTVRAEMNFAQLTVPTA